MTLKIHLNGNESLVYQDLTTITSDPGMSALLTGYTIPDPDGGPPVSVNGDGRVFFRTPAPATPEIGNGLVRWLVDQTNLEVLVRGEGPGFEYLPGKPLLMAGAVTSPMVTKGSMRLIEVAYDPTGCNDGTGAKGYWVEDATGIHIPSRTDVSLFHELVHAFRKANYNQSATDPEGQAVRDSPGENGYRLLRGLPLRATTPAKVHSGGPNCALPPPPTTTKPPPISTRGKGWGCFIATAAYGSPIEPEVELLRRFRNDVLLRTRAGAAFFERFYRHYYAFSPAIAEAMRADPEMAATIRFALVEPITHFLDLVLRQPDAPLDGVPEPWHGFLAAQLDLVERWASQLELPCCFVGVPAPEAAAELAVVLRYALRSPERRQGYLDRLAERGQIPLQGTPAELSAAREALELAGRPTEEVDRIVAPARSGAGALFSVDEAPDIAGQNKPQWFYTVTIRNSTNVSLDPNQPPVPISLDFRIFYKRKNRPGVVFLEVLNVPPATTAVFPMGVCGEMESYVWGAWGLVEVDGQLIYDRVVASVDLGLGDITPQKANQWSQQHGGQDTDPCADSWEVNS
jgi:hypothetical protein